MLKPHKIHFTCKLIQSNVAGKLIYFQRHQLGLTRAVVLLRWGRRRRRQTLHLVSCG